jgi:hypothetical protein
MTSPDALGEAGPTLAASLILANPALETGDADGAFELFSCAARLVLATSNGHKRLHERVKRTLDATKELEDSTAKAESLRDEFAEIVGEIPEIEEERPLSRMQAYLAVAISIGAPAYNLGDRRGCFQVYSCTARMLLATLVEGPPEARSRLEDALEECEGLEDDNDRAWAMRHGFDDVGEMRDGSGLSSLDLRQQIALAIRLGAPAFNAGDHRGCYEVYACTARLLLGGLDPGEGAGKLLAEALQRASLQSSVTEQAWTMREAFDAVLASSEDEEASEENEPEDDDSGDEEPGFEGSDEEGEEV